MAAGVMAADIVARLRAETSQFTAGMRSASASVGALEAAGARASSSLGSNLTRAGRMMETVGSKFSTAGRTMTRYVSAPLAAIGVISVKSAMDFGESMKKIQVLAGDTGRSAGQLEQIIFKLAHTTAQGPQSLAEGLYFTASAGLKGKAVLDTLKLSAEAAGAGLGDAGDIAQVLTSALNAYAGTGLTAAKATNVLIEAVRRGKAEPAELASSLGAVIATASQAGVAFNDVAAAVASATNYGVSAARAVTGLRFLIQNLSSPTAKAEKALKAYGVTAAQLHDMLAKPQGILTALTMLADKFDLSSVEGRAAWNAVIGGARGALVANTLVGKNVDAVKGNFEDLGRAAQSSGDMAAAALRKVAQTPAFKAKQALSDLQVSAIRLGRSLIPVAQTVIGFLEKAAHWFAGLNNKQRENAIRWGAIALAAGPVLRIFGGLLKVGGALFRAGGWLTKVLGVGRGAGGVLGTRAAATAVMNVTADVVNVAGAVGGGVPGVGGGVGAAERVGETAATSWGARLAGRLSALINRIPKALRIAGGLVAPAAVAYEGIKHGPVAALQKGTNMVLPGLSGGGTLDMKKYTSANEAMIESIRRGKATFGGMTVAETQAAAGLTHTAAATRAYTAAINGLSPKLRSWGQSVANSNQLSKANKAQILQLAQVYTAWGGTLTKSQRAYLETYTRVGDVQDAVKLLGGAIQKLPAFKHVKVNADNIDRTLAQIIAVRNHLAELRDRTVHIHLITSGGGGPVAQATGSVRLFTGAARAASGFVARGTTVMAEVPSARPEAWLPLRAPQTVGLFTDVFRRAGLLSGRGTSHTRGRSGFGGRGQLAGRLRLEGGRQLYAWVDAEVEWRDRHEGF